MFRCSIHAVFHDAIQCLIAALEARDRYSHGHSERVADMVYQLAGAAGLKDWELETVHIAAHLHDIGKIGIPDKILRKPGKLNPHEWAQIRRHPEIGWRILNSSQHLKQVAKIVLYHHERWDGRGYPAGLKGEEIPLGARLLAVCDSIDAMTSDRPYRRALCWKDCRKEIESSRAAQFDPALVDLLETLWPEWEKSGGRQSPGIRTAG